ncbi:MAG TPA: tetratricopeptide repeat protein [Thermoanaerobaculia bacterium]|jgi:predicted regulator of Ras-like GTPase activity (Roadblock/LC7/MglB family)
MALFGGPSQPVTRLEELKRLLQRDPTSRQFLALAEEFRRHGKYRDAVITLERGLALHATSVAGHVALGKTYQQLDRLEDAIRAFQNALRIDRENLVAIRQLAEVYLAKGDKIEAIKKLKLYRGLKAGDRDVNDIIARLEQEMTAAVGERAGFRSGARPAAEAPPAFVPGPASSSTLRRAALLRKLETRAPEATAPPFPTEARAADPMAVTYDGASIARALERSRPIPVVPPSPPPPPPLDDLFLQTTPEPAAPAVSAGEVSPFTAPIPQVRESAPAPDVPAAPAPFEVSPPDVDLDDVPTAPFQFPVDLYRVGSAPEPAAALPEAQAPAAAVAPEPAPPPPPDFTEPPLVTPTLAALYEKQGFAADARETYRTLAETEADEARARTLRDKSAAIPAERRDRPHLRRLARRFPKRPEATANDLHAMIRALVESTEGIRAATLTDLEGLPVVAAGPGARESSQEVLVAELTSFLNNVGRSAGEVGAGRLRSLALAGANGTAIVSRVSDDYSLILHVDPDAILGEVRWEAERTARALGPAVR